jgi:hypothetical protein
MSTDLKCFMYLEISITSIQSLEEKMGETEKRHSNMSTPAGARSGEYGGLLSVSPPEEHHERRTFCRRGGNPRTCDSGSAIDS